MKKIVFLSLVTLSMFASVKSQAFQKGTTVINAGLGLGWYSYGYTTSSFPAISLSGEKGVYELEGLGIISIGGIVGYKHSSYDYNLYGLTNTKWSWNDYIIAGRGAFHFDLFNNNKIDPYVGIAVGVRISTYDNPISGYNGITSGSNTYGLFAGYLGCRYFFTDKLAGFGELGYGLGYLTLGLSYKIN